MSDIAKWGLLVAGIVIIVGLIVATGAMTGLTSSIEYVGSTFASFSNIVAPYFVFAKGFLNHFFPPLLLNAVIAWSIMKPFATWTIKLIKFVYSWIFK